MAAGKLAAIFFCKKLPFILDLRDSRNEYICSLRSELFHKGAPVWPLERRTRKTQEIWRCVASNYYIQ
jgi:hypothetical protein